MNPADDLVPVLKKLRLSGVLQSLDLRLRQATDGDVSHIEFLYRLFVDEVERREGKQLQLRLGRAAFDSLKSWDDFDFSFNPAHQMFAALRAARADGTFDRKLTRYTTPRLLIIDDLGLRPLGHDEPMDLYQIIRARYEKASTILTSNRDVTEWYPLFGDPLLASAAMDRVLHYSHVLVLDGQSFRTAAKAA